MFVTICDDSDGETCAGNVKRRQACDPCLSLILDLQTQEMMNWKSRVLHGRDASYLITQQVGSCWVRITGLAVSWSHHTLASRRKGCSRARCISGRSSFGALTSNDAHGDSRPATGLMTCCVTSGSRQNIFVDPRLVRLSIYRVVRMFVDPSTPADVSRTGTEGYPYIHK